jgi:S-adenosyl methyltransferase
LTSEYAPASGGDPDGGAGGEAGRNGDHPSFDTSVAHVARIYDYWLGGKDNYAVDRAAGDAALQAFPGLVDSVRANRAFLARAVTYLAGQGFRQFLDIGTGIPTANNTHEVAQSVAPQSRVVYVDNDPIVLAHARALLSGSPEGATEYLDADLRDTGTIIRDARRTLDFSQPVAIMLLTILHLISDEEDPYRIVATLMGAVPPGSALVISHVAADIETEALGAARDRVSQYMRERQTYRNHAEVSRFFDGLEVVEPGVVMAQQWRPNSDLEARATSAVWCAVGIKP